MHLFPTSPNLHQRPTVLNAHAPNCYIMMQIYYHACDNRMLKNVLDNERMTDAVLLHHYHTGRVNDATGCLWISLSAR